MKPNKSHGGKRKGAGRKPAADLSHTKRFRATEFEWAEFLSLLDGDTRIDFLIVLDAVRRYFENVPARKPYVP
jgi:hypothetical protein